MALLGAQFVNAVSPNPVGSLQAYAGPNAPTGWLLCDGSSYSTSAWPELYDAIGYTYGGSAGTFYVPDLRGRVPMGAGTGAQQGGSGSGVISGGTALTARSLGQFGGDERLHQHTHAQNSHNHSQNPHTHYIYSGPLGGVHPTIQQNGNNGALYGPVQTVTATNNPTTATNQNTGSGQSENMPPFLVTNYIIKAVTDAPRSGLAYGSTPPIVTQLPSNPQFGDVVTYIADATNGVSWSLQYDASGSYPWKYIGGPPLYDAGGGYQAITSTSYVDLTGVTINTTLAGDYDVRLDAQLQQPNTNGWVTYLSVSHAGGTLGDYTYPIVYAPSTGGTDNGASRMARILDLTANNTLQGRARVNAGTGYVGFCRLTATPVRVAG
jgi:microcystin-dependent protein